MRTPCVVAAAALAVGLAGCPPRATEPVGSGTVEPERADDPDDPGPPWRAGDGTLHDSESGLELDLPTEWEVRPGAGPFVWEARDPAWYGTWVRIGRQDGSLDSRQEWMASGLEGWLGDGPWSGLEELADGPIEVGTRELPDGGLVVAWWFELDGRGVLIEAGLPARGFEVGWESVDGIVRSAHRRSRP